VPKRSVLEQGDRARKKKAKNGSALIKPSLERSEFEEQ